MTIMLVATLISILSVTDLSQGGGCSLPLIDEHYPPDTMFKPPGLSAGKNVGRKGIVISHLHGKGAVIEYLNSVSF